MNTPTPKVVRLTIPVPEDVHAVYKRLAVAARMPVGRVMADWLADCQEAVAFVAEKAEQARVSPQAAARSMALYAASLTEMTDGLVKAAASHPDKGAGVGARATAPVPRRGRTPPTGNTGG